MMSAVQMRVVNIASVVYYNIFLFLFCFCFFFSLALLLDGLKQVVVSGSKPT